MWCYVWIICLVTRILSSKAQVHDGPEETDNLNGTLGSIASDNWPSAYYPNTQHRWIITTPPGTVVSLHFASTFELEAAWSSNNCYDYVNIFDGRYAKQLTPVRCQSPYSVPIAVRACGAQPPLDYVSSTNVLIVEFCTDSTVQEKGFGFQWTALTASTFNELLMQLHSENTGCSLILVSTTPHPPSTPYPAVCGQQSTQYPSDIQFFNNGSVKAKPSFRAVGIVGGKQAPAHSWPWTAAVFRQSEMSNQWSQTCGGTLINNQWMLSAAHCFPKDKDPSSYCIKFGANNKGVDCTLNELTQQVCTVQWIYLHPNFTNSMHPSSDIALVKLNCVVNYTAAVQPVCVPTIQEAVFTSENVVVTGWGFTVDSGNPSQLLQEVVVSVVDHDQCATDYRPLNLPVDQTMFCANAPGKDACAGDSGGPLVSYQNGAWFLSGIVSWGSTCADARYPGVYVNVPYFRSWIDQTITSHYYDSS